MGPVQSGPPSAGGAGLLSQQQVSFCLSTSFNSPEEPKTRCHPPLHRQCKPQPPGEIGVPRLQATCSLAASQAGVLCLCKTQMESCSLPVFTATLTPRRFLPPPLEFLGTFLRTKRLVLPLQRMKKTQDQLSKGPGL